VSLGYSLSDIRERVFEDWAPPWQLPLFPHEDAGLKRTWLELQSVASVQAWDSVVVQTGKLLEKTLVSALTRGQEQPPRDQTDRMPNLRRMLQEAEKTAEGLGSRSGANLIAGDNIRRIRNLSAHFSELGSTELHATQAIVTLLVFVEALVSQEPEPSGALQTPRDADDGWFIERWHEIKPNVLARWFIAADDVTALNLMNVHGAAVACRLFQASSSRSLTRLPERMARLLEYRDVFGREFHARLVWILSCMSLGPSSNWRRFVLALGSLGLDLHRDVCTTLFPYDSEWLASQLESTASPHLVTRTIRRMRTASNQQWGLLASNENDCERIAVASWKRWEANPTASFASNRFLLALSVPPALGARIVRHAPKDALSQYILSTSQLPKLVRVIRLAIADPTLPPARREEIWTSFLVRLNQAPVHEIKNVPVGVHLTGMTSGVAGQTILNICLSKSPVSSSDRRPLLRMLLVIWLVSRNLRVKVGERARQLILDGPLDWLSLECAGLIDISDQPAPRLDSLEVDGSALLVPTGDMGRDEIGLGLIGALAVTTKLQETASIQDAYRRYLIMPTIRDHIMPGHDRFDHRLSVMSWELRRGS
jgi:hypothetical protein